MSATAPQLPEIVRGPVIQDGAEVWYLRCPGCGLVAAADLDQCYGRVSIDCPDCEYHETVRIFVEETPA